MGILFKQTNEPADNFKRWVLVIFTLLIPILLGVWGICLSLASNKLAKVSNKLAEQTSRNTEQIDELKKQTQLMQKSVSILDSNHKTYLAELKYSKQPNLKAELWGGTLDQIADIDVKLTNLGASISNLIFVPLNDARISPTGLPKNRIIASGGSCIIKISNLRSGTAMRIVFRDALKNKYSQDLSWTLDGEVLEFGKMKEIKE